MHLFTLKNVSAKAVSFTKFVTVKKCLTIDQARQISENLFEILVSRWLIKTVISLESPVATKLILAALALHKRLCKIPDRAAV